MSSTSVRTWARALEPRGVHPVVLVDDRPAVEPAPAEELVLTPPGRHPHRLLPRPGHRGLEEAGWIGSTRAVRVVARDGLTDQRRGFDGLYALVVHELDQDPPLGERYLLVHARRTSAKGLLWDGTGLSSYAKRLARHRLSRQWQDASEGRPWTMTHSDR